MAGTMNKLLAALARRLEDRQAEPGFLTKTTMLVLALCILAALLL
jgi:hypothetical protein